MKYNEPKGTVPSIIKWYKKKYGDNVENSLGTAAAEQPTPAVHYLELKEADLKITALKILIKNAGKTLGNNLVKKFVTK